MSTNSQNVALKNIKNDTDEEISTRDRENSAVKSNVQVQT